MAQKLSQAAAIYWRVSSKDQEREGYSLDSQERLLRSYALAKGLTIVRDFNDVETAKRTGRRGFNEMVAFLKKSRTCKTLSLRRRTGSIEISKTGARWRS